ncbi:MAG: segregation/condensation protein B [Clostridiales bacterium]|uniref:SMC-Scp complex subunit ScpB n=1 Tax=Clostridium sp. N3C TaxID=1776758 RepID=UPI00092E02C6|nr:SMC-Scp complex subunit ScpB [Clostridium sp. N3C]NLZ47693.1 segregation/condensation protein B [Clostridiales bacterium]SCN21399.1 Segregation and condensation protein B [Clostridium sp. N3C]
MRKDEILQTEMKEISNKDKYFSIIESLLFVSGEPMKLKQIAEIIECSVAYTKKILKEMMFNYEESNRGIKLVNMNDEYQLVTKADNSEYVLKILKNSHRQALSQASLETLAIIAYKQPITRVEIDEIRGVKSESAINRLLEKNLIKEAGRLDAPGRPALFATTDEFLKHFNLQNIKELPSIESIIDEYLDEDDTGNNKDEVAAENESL